jgi:phenylacetate-coenzyme A ligase PaaK-like adenylate-forming protein
MFTTPSAAVRLAALAARWGVELDGVSILAGMEPLTPGKAAEVKARGARIGSIYGLTEAGIAAVPCGDPVEPDDMHLAMHDLALIPHRRSYGEVEALDAFMLTSLTSTPPKVLLNVETDDFGTLARRRCGCPLDDLGLHAHLSSVRSFTKLTGEGSTILGTDCVRILEEVLPREFGGRSIDYQLLEEEDEAHLTRLNLLVSPDVGAVDEGGIRQRFIEEVRARTAQHLRMWRQAETIRVMRRYPVATPRGKILPFHTQARVAPVGAEAAAAGTVTVTSDRSGASAVRP